ncbi:hypothetical protein [Nocardioides hwasunensis]|uniref:Lipoprotein n=1 Tax=Nocardioides hwasunensis TaxID=397258 RepID=A0ABR8MI06_9ACTN|nr:hypothetical protein [Nocardioides hwasunensis]MBD3915205.1 hypothetical protein [Nocardioides hwasunensis]
MRQHSKVGPRLMTAATTVVVGLLLTGCGSASPGVAVKVGDDEITVRQVDQAAGEMCTALGDQFAASGTVLPMGFVRQGTVQLLTLRAQALQVAADYDVEPGSTYQNAVSQSRGSVAALPEDVQDTYLELTTANALANDVVGQVGKIVLADQGNPDPTEEQITQAGAEVFNTWPAANGIDIDPRYGLESVDGVLSPIDTNTSVAVSKTAKDGLNEEPDAAYAATLPLEHRCG